MAIQTADGVNVSGIVLQQGGSVATAGTAIALTGLNTYLTLNATTNVNQQNNNGATPAVQISGNNTSITNAGTIQSLTNNAATATISAAGLVPITSAALNNSGTISTPAGQSSIDYSNVTTGVVNITNAAGATINGSVLLPNGAGSTSIVTLQGGTIGGVITPVAALAGNATTNITGSYTTVADFGRTAAALVTGLTAINVQNSGTTFTVNNFLSSNQFTIASGSSSIFTAGGSWNGFNPNASLTNNGTLSAINTGAITTGNNATITNNGTLNSSGTANVTLGTSSTLINNVTLALFNASNLTFGNNTPVATGVNFTNNASVSLSSNLGDTASITFGNNNVLNNLGSMTLANTARFQKSALANNFSLVNSGTLAMNTINQDVLIGTNNSLTNSGTLTLNGASTLILQNVTNNQSITLNGSSNLNVTGLTTNNASFIVQNTTANGIIGGGNLNNSNGATLNVLNAGTIAANVTNNGSMTVSSTTPNAISGVLINNGTLIVNGTGVNILNIGPITNNGSMTLSNPSGASVVNAVFNNAGTLNLQGQGNLGLITGPLNNNNGGNIVVSDAQSINGAFTQNAGGNFTSNIVDGAEFGSLTLTGANPANLLANSKITTNLISHGSEIMQGQTFDILTTTGAIADASTLVPTGNPLVTFTKSTVTTGNKNAIRLTAIRVPLSNFINPTTTPVLGGLSNTLEAIRNSSLGLNQPFESLLSGVDATFLSGGSTALQNTLLQFTPDVSGALRMIPIWQLENMDFKAIDNRLERVASLQRSRDYIPVEGYVAGDSILGQECSGPLVFGTIGQQKVPMINFPYDFNTGGIGFYTDRGLAECFYMGLTGTYSYTTVLYKNNTGSKTTISTTQAGIYGSYNQGWAFMDGIVTYGFNNYQSKRVQPLISQTSLGSFKGNQGSGRLRTGFAVPIRYFDIIPIGSIQYTQVHIGSYRESGGAALAIPRQAFTAAIWGLGVRLALHNVDIDVKTEVHGMYYQDMKASPIAVTAQFLDGGPAFVTNGNGVKKNHYNAGASANVMIMPNITLCLSYDFLKQESLKSSHFFLRLRFTH